MAKTITIGLSDAEFQKLQKVFSSGEVSESDITEESIKNRCIKYLKSRVGSHDEAEAKKNITYTAFDPS
mgnify:CR=1 FL=1|tara:strand:+ start:470 stop:676 length:207 start_codon:yes stop_codon:yes gene_type:complete